MQKIFTQLVGAVSYVHAKQCVHRDLKLENILLDKLGNVKLVDFGFTREYQGSTSYLQTWCGTVCYSAPEMLKGEKYAGEKVDVWSLGIILYALLCGELPFDEDDESVTKGMILKDEPRYPEHIPEPAKELIKKLLSKRPLLRPSLSDVLKDPWLSEHAPQQQEILKLQQPAPFSTQLEKDTLQRMRSAGVDIDMVIENVLSQRCDGLAGWWALLIEKETRKERRKERKRKEREADAKSIRRLSAASNRLLAQSALLGEINEGEESIVDESPHPRGRRSKRNASLHRRSHVEEMPQVAEGKPDTPPLPTEHNEAIPKPPRKDDPSRSRSRPPPPPKDGINPVIRRPRNTSRGSASMLKNATTNPDLLSPSYVPPPQRKKKVFYQQPLREQLAMFKHWFKESAKRAKSPTNADGSSGKSNGPASPGLFINGKKHVAEEGSLRRDLTRTSSGPRTSSIGSRPDLTQRQTMPARPRINTNASFESRKRQSLSPHTLTPHSSYRRSSGLRGRKSTSSSVSSIRSAYPSVPGHKHTHSKASSTSSTSLASPSGLSATSGSRHARSPHNSVKMLPATPTNTAFPSGIRVSRRPPPSALGTLPAFAEAKASFGAGGLGPSSPGLPVFARRKRSVFKGPMANSSSPSGLGRVAMGTKSRSNSIPGRRSTEVIGGIQEEEEDIEEEEDELVGGIDEDEGILANAMHDDDAGKWEDTDQFGPELESAVAPMPESGIRLLAPSRLSEAEADRASSVGSGPLTHEALRKKDALDEETAANDKGKGKDKVEPVAVET